MNNSNSSPTGKSWDTYWRGTGDTGAYTSGGANHPAIQTFWSDFFAPFNNQSKNARIIDLATGNGAVVAAARDAFDTNNANITCLDISAAAVRNVQDRFPGVSGITADAADIPLADEAFDLVTSQFGVEYAGVEAIYEAARLVAPDASLAMLIHIVGGSIFKECDDSVNAIRQLQDAKFVPLASELFRTGFAAVRGADRAPYDAAGRKFAPAVKAAEDVMQRLGEHVAGDTIARLYDDVARLHSGLTRYEPDEVLTWLKTMDRELDAYVERMSSMHDAAIDSDLFHNICQRLTEIGMSIQRAETLHPTVEQLPLAWALIAKRQAS